MGEGKYLDISQYLNDGVISLENLNIANSTIMALQMEWTKNSLDMKNCSLENVVFENHCGRGSIEISDCKFTNCVFHDTLGNGKLDVKQSIFTNCTFERICLNGTCDSSEISQCKFFNCKFHQIDLKWKIELFELELNGVKIDQLCLAGQQYITGNRIFNMQIENMKMWGEFFNQNRIENVIFKDVVLTGNKGEAGTKQENIFIDCDVKGLTFVEGTLGFDSL